MKRPNAWVLTGAAGVVLALAAAATSAQVSDGAVVATQGAGGAPCASCHGARGEGNAGGGFPRLAAQPAAYLARQLELYANGQRQNPIMSPIAQQLSPAQRMAVAGYYAGLDGGTRAQASARAGAPPGAGAQRLATVGDEHRDIQGCANCHGPQGRGEPPLLPYLAGQVPSYITATLQNWKTGARKTDPSLQMNHVAAQLTDAEIGALAQYFAQQPAPVPAIMAAAPAQQAGAPSPSTSSAPSSSPPKQGVGIDQGSATTGGGQGQGAGGAASGTGPTGGSANEKR